VRRRFETLRSRPFSAERRLFLPHAAPTQYSSIPFNVKALKLLVAEAGAAKQSGDYNASWEQDDGEEDEDEDDGAEWEDDGPAFLKTGPKPTDEFGFLSGASGASVSSTCSRPRLTVPCFSPFARHDGPRRL
jgi:hypothetical protein